MFRRLCHLIGAAAVAVPSAAFAGGPWPQPENQGFAITTFDFLTAQNFPNIQNPAYGKGTYRQFVASSYVEYGLTNQITLGAMPEFEIAQLKTSEGTRTTSGFGDLELFARTVAWQQGAWWSAVQGTVKLPTGYDANANPALGNGQVDFEPSASVGRGFNLGRWPSYAYIEAGYRFRFAGPNDQIRINFLAGTRPADRWTIQLASFDIVNTVQPPRGINFNLDTWMLTAIYDISTHWSVQLGAFTQAAATNFSTGSGISTGVWWRF